METDPPEVAGDAVRKIQIHERNKNISSQVKKKIKLMAGFIPQV